ncbi:spermatogenesis-associated protein 1 [Neosynchiropus ocellatus]
MELSCESLSFPEDRRPNSCKFVELHVLYVPEDQWNMRLNKVPSEAIDSFISHGFIRVHPDLTLKSLRNELASLIGAERNIDKLSFLKCLGRSLALVKSNQERDLKVKTFAPPYAPQPELYLLPKVENDSSICSESLSPETSSSSPDHRHYYPPKTWNLPAEAKERLKFPRIPQYAPQPAATASLGEGEEEEEREDERNFSSSDSDDGHEATSPNKSEWVKKESCCRNPHSHREDLRQSTAQTKSSPEEEEWSKKATQRPTGAARHPAVSELQEERRSDLSAAVGSMKPPEACGSTSRSKETNWATQSPAVLSRPVRCTSPPPGLEPETTTHNKPGPPIFFKSREEVIEEMRLVREERKQLEWKRQELLRKGKDLLAQNRHRRNQARDSWKKKYFETKKATAPLEETLRNLRQELETFYNKLLHQLQARDHRGKPRKQGRSSAKNELIIQIMTESHEIDDLKRKVDDAKMKLVTEVKLRKQAATELRALKAELAQKKSQSSHPGLLGGAGNASREKPPVQSSSG